MRCLATGRPSPSIFWGKEGVTSVLFPGMSVANVYVTGDGCLKIRDPVEENSGMYTCTVVNDVGAAMALSQVQVMDSEASNDSFQVAFINLNFLFSATLYLILQLRHSN